jgi:hypothetical protein
MDTTEWNGVLPEPTFVYVVTPAGSGWFGSSPRESERQLNRYLLSHHPPAYLSEEEGISVARQIASDAANLQQWAVEAGRAMGMSDVGLEELQSTVLPRSYSHVIKVQLYDVTIEEIEDFEWESWLGGSADIVSLPHVSALKGSHGSAGRGVAVRAAGRTARGPLRIVATESLLGRCAIIKVTKVYA